MIPITATRRLLCDAVYYLALLILIAAGVRASLSLVSVSVFGHRQIEQRLDRLESRVKADDESRRSVPVSKVADKVPIISKARKRLACQQADKPAIEVIQGATVSRIQVARR